MSRRSTFSTLSMLVALLCLAAACENQAASPGPRSAGGARPAPWRNDNIDLAQKCGADADCPGGEVCEGVIRAACETCDGGPVVKICKRAVACGDDTNCLAPRTCGEVDCPTCAGGKAGECR